MPSPSFIIAQILSAIALIANVIGIQLKEKKQILKVWIIAGVCFTASFIFLGAYAGAVSCLIATIQIVVNYGFERRRQKFPPTLIAVFIVASLLGGTLTYQNIYDFLPIFGALTFIWSIVQKKESRLRKITFLNIFLWIFYDFLVGAYVAFISDLIFLTSTAIAIVRFDFLRQKTQSKDGNILT